MCDDTKPSILELDENYIHGAAPYKALVQRRVSSHAARRTLAVLARCGPPSPQDAPSAVPQRRPGPARRGHFATFFSVLITLVACSMRHWSRKLMPQGSWGRAGRAQAQRMGGQAAGRPAGRGLRLGGARKHGVPQGTPANRRRQPCAARGATEPGGSSPKAHRVWLGARLGALRQQRAAGGRTGGSASVARRSPFLRR
jgi:hypothetical protein